MYLVSPSPPHLDVWVPVCFDANLIMFFCSCPFLPLPLSVLFFLFTVFCLTSLLHPALVSSNLSYTQVT